MVSPVTPSRLSGLLLPPLLPFRMRSARLRLRLAKLEVAGAGGIEPPLRGPKPRVLPLNDAPVPSSAHPDRRSRIGPDRPARPAGPADARADLTRVVEGPRERAHRRAGARHDWPGRSRRQEGRLQAGEDREQRASDW